MEQDSAVKKFEHTYSDWKDKYITTIEAFELLREIILVQQDEIDRLKNG